jgi:hypothetical protein
MEKHVILGVHVTDRLENALPVQQVLTEYGCHIKTRMGLHEVGGEGLCCSKNGLLLIEFIGGEDAADAMMGKLETIHGIDVQKMVFDHPV